MLGAATDVASVLTTDAEVEGVADTAVHVHLLHALKIFAELDVDGVGGEVLCLAGLDVALTVDEPRGDLVLEGIGDDVGDLLDLGGGEGTRAALVVDAGLLADEEGEADTDTLDHAEGIRDLALTVDVGVEDTLDVGEVVGLEIQRHFLIFFFFKRRKKEHFWTKIFGCDFDFYHFFRKMKVRFYEFSQFKYFFLKHFDNKKIMIRRCLN